MSLKCFWEEEFYLTTWPLGSTNISRLLDQFPPETGHGANCLVGSMFGSWTHDQFVESWRPI